MSQLLQYFLMFDVCYVSEFFQLSIHIPKLLAINCLGVFVCRVENNVCGLVHCEEEGIQHTEWDQIFLLCFRCETCYCCQQGNTHQRLWFSWLSCCSRSWCWFWLGLLHRGNKAEVKTRRRPVNGGECLDNYIAYSQSAKVLWECFKL